MIDYYDSVEEDGIGMVQCHRGLGKSQLGMEFSLFCICEGYEAYILFVGGTQDLTNDLVASASELALDISNIKVVRAVEGILEIKNKLGQDAFLVAKSTGSKLRGVAKGKLRQRPTAIVLDDIVDDQLVLNRLRMDRANRWLTSALFPTLVPGGKVFGSGTPMNAGDPFMSLCSSFGSFKIPLSNTSFPDRFTPKYIGRKKAQYEKLGQLRDWKREFELVLTDSETALFDMKKIQYCAEDEVPDDLEYYMTLDGAFSEKDSADYSSFAILGVDKNGHWYVDSRSLRGKPTEIVSKLFEYQNRCGALDIGIEKGSWLLSMKSEVEQKMLDYQQYFNVVELNTNGSKISRIKALTHIVNSGRLTIIDNGEESEMLVDQMELTDEIACNASHDDALDAMAQLCQLDIINSDSLLNEHLAASEEDNQTTIYDYED